MLKKHRLYFFAILSLLVSYSAFADVSLGSVANNMTSFVSGLGQFFMTLFFCISFGFLVGTLIKYKAHRDSPSHVTLSVPITTLCLSIAFLCLGLLLYYSPQQVFGPSLKGGNVSGTSQVN